MRRPARPASPPGCDNIGPVVDSGLPRKFDFALFTFEAPVDVKGLGVDDAAKLGRDLFAAAGSAALDFSDGFLSGIAGFEVFKGDDDAGDGPFDYALSFEGVQSVPIGAPPRTDDPLGGILPSSFNDGFFITGLDFAMASVPEPQTPDTGRGAGAGGGDPIPAPIPVPASLPLLAAGLRGIALLRRRRG